MVASQRVKWVSLNAASDPSLRLVRASYPSGAKRLVLVGQSPADADPRQWETLQSLGFYRSPAGVIVRDDLSFSLSMLHRAFPRAVASEMHLNDVIRILPLEARNRESAASAEALRVNNAVMAAVPLGTNHAGQPVFQGDDGRYIGDAGGRVVREADVRTPASFLYARSAEDLALCADGLVAEIAAGRVLRFDDLRRFASVVKEHPESDIAFTPLLREVQEAVEAALVRYMRRHGGALDRAAYALALRMEEGQPPLQARTSDSVMQQQFSTPLPIALVAQRILGPMARRSVLEPTIGNGSLVSALDGARVVGFDLDEARLDNVRRAMPGANLVCADASSAVFVAANGGDRFDAVIANPPFGGLKSAVGGAAVAGTALPKDLKVTRIDHLLLVRSLLARKDDGIGVFIVGADSVIDSKAGEVTGGSRYLFNWLEDNYEVDVVEVDGGLYAKQGSSFPIRIVVVGRKGGVAGQVLDRIPVIRDHEALFEWSERMVAKFHGPRPAAPEDKRAAPEAPPRRTVEHLGRVYGVLATFPEADVDAANGFMSGNPRASLLCIKDGICYLADHEDLGRPLRRTPATPASAEPEGLRVGAVVEIDRSRVPDILVAALPPEVFGATAEVLEIGEGRAMVAVAGGRYWFDVAAISAPDLRPETPDVVFGALPEAVPSEASPEPAEGTAGADLEENSFQSPYASRSRISESTAMIPRNLATPTRNALGAVVEAVGDIDDFVAGSLMWTKEEMATYLSPEQVDAVALAMHSSTRGRGFLDGDQTGIGKGRVIAALARWSALRGEGVVFLTETPTLFTDFWRDLRDIGSEHLFKPLVVNDGVSIYDPITGEKLVRAMPKSVMESALEEGAEADPSYNLVMATYSQFNRPADASAKSRWIARVASGKTLLLDEAHNAAGDSNTGRNIGAAIESAARVVYGSATAMKSAKNVQIFSKLFPETVDVGSLPETLAVGGEVLQEVLSGMLAQDGVFVRREHDLSDIAFRTVADSARSARNREVSDRLATILEFMNYLAGDINELVNERNREIREMLESIPDEERKGNRMGAVKVNFGSRLFAIYRQFLLAIKVDLAAERAIEALEAGKKPVIVLENTMESLVADLVLANRSESDLHRVYEEGGDEALSARLSGEVEVGRIGFREVLSRMLERISCYRETNRYGQVTLVPATSEGAVKTIKEIRRLISEFPDLPASPLDELKRRIADAGFVCDELSGRGIEIVERGGAVVAAPLRERPKAQVVKDFVTGESDALILTRAGSTGISLHASERFPDRRRRVMIELQSAADVNVRVQFFGRVNRKGQVSAPEIETLSSDLIGEARPIAMQNAKLRRLSANTTSNQDNSALDRSVPDFINKVGDEVAFRFLESNPSVAARLGIEVGEEAGETPDSFYINKLTSRLVMLRVDEQEAIYEALTTEYLRVMKELDSKGSNPLRTREFDVRATEVGRFVFEAGDPHSNSMFSQPVYAKTIEFDVSVEPIRSAGVRSRIAAAERSLREHALNRSRLPGAEFLAGLVTTLVEQRMTLLGSALGKAHATVEEALAARESNAVQKMDERLRVLGSLLSGLDLGAVVRFTNDEGDVEHGVVARIAVPENPSHLHLLGSYEIGIVVPGKQHAQDRTLYSLRDDAHFRVLGNGTPAGEDMMERFDRAEAGLFRRRRMILDGNLFRAAQIAATARIGGSVIYTDQSGARHRGVLLARGIGSEHLNALPMRIETPTMAVEVLDRGVCQSLTTATSAVYERESDLRVSVEGDIARIEVPGTKSAGGRWFGNSSLTTIVGQFSGSRTVMCAKFPVAKLKSAIAAIYREGASLYAPPGVRQSVNEMSESVYANEGMQSSHNRSNMAATA